MVFQRICALPFVLAIKKNVKVEDVKHFKKLVTVRTGVR